MAQARSPAGLRVRRLAVPRPMPRTIRTGRAVRQIPGRYWRIWAATGLSNLGDGISLVAMPLLAASFTADPITIAGVGLFTPLAKIFVSLGGGVLVDRSDRRTLMVAADLFRLVAMAGFTGLVVSDEISFAAVYAVVFTLAVGEFLYDTAATAVVRDIVPASRLTTANGWLYAAEDGAQDLIAPPLGAALFVLVAWAPFALDALTFAISALLVLSVRGRFKAERRVERTSVRRDLREGFGFIGQHSFFRAAMAVWMVLGFALGLALATLVLFVLGPLGSGEYGFAAVVTAGAIGIVVGNLLTGRLERRFGVGRVLVIAVAIGGVSLVATGVSPVLTAAAGAQVFWGLGFALANTQMVSVRQRLVPDELLGRVTGVFGLMSSVGMLVGVMAGGVLTKLGTPRVPLLVAGGVQIATGLVWWLVIRGSSAIEAAPSSARDHEPG